MSRSAAAPPRALRGFEGAHRYWDNIESNWVAPVLPGDFYVTRSGEIISTVLGSCVSTCVRDPGARVSGLNHFMLPNHGGAPVAGDALRYGCFAVERLLNELIKYGATRERLEVKIFGGGKVIPGMGDIGQKNILFVHDYFEAEGLAIRAEDVGGTWARRVRFHTDTGRVMIQRLATRETNEVADQEKALNRRLSIAPPRGEVDLFA